MDALPAFDLPILDAPPEAPTLAALLAALTDAPARPVVLFRPDTGAAVRAGYHVTEVLATAVRSVDCGGRPHAWEEVVLQVLDEADPGARTMHGGRVAGIVRRVDRLVGLPMEAPVVVEWGRPGEAAPRFDLVAVRAEAAALVLDLAPRAAACKPRDEGLSIC